MRRGPDCREIKPDSSPSSCSYFHRKSGKIDKREGVNLSSSRRATAIQGIAVEGPLVETRLNIEHSISACRETSNTESPYFDVGRFLHPRFSLARRSEDGSNPWCLPLYSCMPRRSPKGEDGSIRGLSQPLAVCAKSVRYLTLIRCFQSSHIPHSLYILHSFSVGGPFIHSLLTLSFCCGFAPPGNPWQNFPRLELQSGIDYFPFTRKFAKVKILGASPEAFDIRLYELETKQASGN